MNKNPYANAAGTYGNHAQKHTPNQRELEARVLLKAAHKFQLLQENWDDVTQEMLEEVLMYNRQLWMMFVDTAVEDTDEARPQALRNNIASLGIFIFKHTVKTISQPSKDKLDILIEINREIAAGLTANIKSEGKKPDSPAAEPASGQQPAAYQPSDTLT